MIYQVSIIEQTVLGLNSYHAECQQCGWRCHAKPHTTDAQAIRCAERHNH